MATSATTATAISTAAPTLAPSAAQRLMPVWICNADRMPPKMSPTRAGMVLRRDTGVAAVEEGRLRAESWAGRTGWEVPEPG
jgi:hypothetical protein